MPDDEADPRARRDLCLATLEALDGALDGALDELELGAGDEHQLESAAERVQDLVDARGALVTCLVQVDSAAPVAPAAAEALRTRHGRLDARLAALRDRTSGERRELVKGRRASIRYVRHSRLR